MGVESLTTVDRMQVEFSTNLNELIGSLHTVESRLDSVNDSFVQSEAASQSYADSMEQAGSAAAASSQGFATLAAGIDTFAASSQTGTAAAAICAGSLDDTQAAITSLNYLMEYTVDKFHDVNTAATGTATAIGRINNISNNAYTTFARLNTNSTSAAKAIAKLSTETRSLQTAYTIATTGTETFAKSISNAGTATNTVVSQINQYSTAINTAGREASTAAGEMDKIVQKTDETETAMGKLSNSAGKVFSVAMVGTLLDTLDTILERGMQVSSMFQGIASDISTSLGSITPELTAGLNGVVEDLLGSVPVSQNDALASGMSLLYKYQPEWDTTTYEDMMREYASYADLWNMNLSDLIGATQRLFTKYNITTSEKMKEALGMINAVNNLAPDAVPSSIISIMNNNRQAIGAQGWNFEDVLSRIVNAGNDRAMSKFQEYLSALQNVKATKAGMFSSDEAFAEWIRTVTGMVRNAKDETDAANIIKNEFNIHGTSAVEIAKYLRLTGSETDRTGQILAQLESNGTGYRQYLQQETSRERIARDESQTTKADRTVGDTMNDLKVRVADQLAYERELYDVASIHLGDFATYVDKIPVVGEILSPFTGLVKDYLPEITIAKDIRGTPEEFIERYETRLNNGDYVQEMDPNYYLSYRKLADKLAVDYSDLEFSGTDAAAIVDDLAAGLYTDLILRVKAAQNGEEVRPLAEQLADIIGDSGFNLNVESFTGTLQMPDGTVVSGTDAGLWPFESAETSELETATVQGDFAAVAQGDASISAAGDMMISAEQATIVADLEPLAELITVSPQITVEVTVPAEQGSVTYQVPAAVQSPVVMPEPSFMLETPAEDADAQASVGFAMQSMAENRAGSQTIAIDYSGTLQTLTDTVMYLATLVRSIAGKDMSYTQNTSISQNFYAPAVDSYTVRNAASRAVNAAQAAAFRTRT